jgi:benzoyl-CoA reductase/2-hydroxyglutaryl-CoA dehydratase subunit BcrC/BadD/HgdB
MPTETLEARDIQLTDLRRKDFTGVKLKTRDEVETQIDHIRQTQKDHAHSKGVQKILKLYIDYVVDAENAARNGKSVSWASAWEVPILYACDTIPVTMSELGRLGSKDAISVAEDYFQLPKETCSMVTSMLGEWLLRKNTPIRRIVGWNSSCEPINMAREMIRKEGYDVYRIEGITRPPRATEERRQQMTDFLAEEYRGLAKWLTGKPVNEKAVTREIERANRIATKSREILDLRPGNPYFIKSLATMFLLMGGLSYFGKPEEFEEALDLTLEEIKGSDIIHSPNARKVPLMWIGGRGQEFSVYQALDDAGAVVLGWQTPSAVGRLFRTDIDPVQSLAEYIANGQWVGTPVHRLEAADKQAEKFGIKGILFYNYIGCSFASVHTEIQREHFHKKGIPSISLEGSFQVGPPTGQLLTRVRAFMEMLS